MVMQNERGQNTHRQGEKVKIPLYQTMLAKIVLTKQDHKRVTTRG